MRKYTNNSFFQYALIACVAFALIFGQLFKLHMHIEHNKASSSATSEHTLGMHAAFSVSDIKRAITNNSDNHDSEIKVSPDSLVKKNGSLSTYLFLFLFISIFLGLPAVRSIFRQSVQAKLISTYYLLCPPLRAPPIHSPA